MNDAVADEIVLQIVENEVKIGNFCEQILNLEECGDKSVQIRIREELFYLGIRKFHTIFFKIELFNCLPAHNCFNVNMKLSFWNCLKK